MFYLWGIVILFAGGFIALSCSSKPRLSERIGAFSAMVGLLLSGVPVLSELSHNITAYFQLPIIILGFSGAIHSLGYLKGEHGKRIGLYWFFYNMTICAMLGVTLCHQQLGFLILWEIMGLASFALVAFDYDRKTTAKAAWIYLLSCQAGSMFIIPMFIFNSNANVTMLLAILGFGLKIGFPMLHIWLPEAHPAAPAPVSALMSGAMIQLGFLGIGRWGLSAQMNIELYAWIFLLLGILGSIGGIIFAMGQNNLKKLLAWSSIENMGIIAIGIGLWQLGRVMNVPAVAAGGFGAVVLHLINHAILKGGLFLGAGSVLKSTNSLNIDDLGGLLKRLPCTGTTFIINAVGLSGLPPFSGFISEFLIYFAAVSAICSNIPALSVSGVAVLIAMSLTGGLASATFVKAIGGIFLGEPRSDNALTAKELPVTMTFPLIFLLALSAVTVFVAPSLLAQILTISSKTIPAELLNALTNVCMISIIITLLSFIFATIRIRIKTRNSVTWDCGYAAPNARMEYTGSAIIQPLTTFFSPLLRPKRQITSPAEEFPKKGEFKQDFDDLGMQWFWVKIFSVTGKIADKIHFLQSGYLHLYILIITVVLLLMVIWGLILPWSGNVIGGVN